MRLTKANVVKWIERAAPCREGLRFAAPCREGLRFAREQRGTVEQIVNRLATRLFRGQDPYGFLDWFFNSVFDTCTCKICRDPKLTAREFARNALAVLRKVCVQQARYLCSGIAPDVLNPLENWRRYGPEDQDHRRA